LFGLDGADLEGGCFLWTNQKFHVRNKERSMIVKLAPAGEANLKKLLTQGVI